MFFFMAKKLKFSVCTYSTNDNVYTVKPVLRGHLWDKEKVALWDRWPLNRGSIHMKLSMTWQEKDDLLIQVTI
jgi:hypothetical protein